MKVIIETAKAGNMRRTFIILAKGNFAYDDRLVADVATAIARHSGLSVESIDHAPKYIVPKKAVDTGHHSRTR